MAVAEALTKKGMELLRKTNINGQVCEKLQKVVKDKITTLEVVTDAAGKKIMTVFEKVNPNNSFRPFDKVTKTFHPNGKLKSVEGYKTIGEGKFNTFSSTFDKSGTTASKVSQVKRTIGANDPSYVYNATARQAGLRI